MIRGCLQIKNDKYYAVLYLRVDGVRKPKWVALNLPTKGNKRKAEDALSKLLNEHEEKTEQEKLPPKASDTLFTDYLQSWLKIAKSTVAIITYQGYVTSINGRVNRFFGSRKTTLGEVTPSILQEFYQQILDEGFTANTVHHYHALLHNALKSAMKKELIDKNPADLIDRPKKNRYSGTFYSKEEMQELFAAIKDDAVELPVRIAAYYGLRRSEVIGLRWSSVNFQKKEIAINHKVGKSREKGSNELICEDTLKTKSSLRTLPLLKPVEEILIEAKRQQEENRQLFGNGYCTEHLEYVCVSKLGELIDPDYLTEHFALVLEKNQLKKMRFHDLRHTCASLLLAEGVSMKQIQIWLGHSTFSTTADIYAHLDAAAQQQTGNVAEGLFERKDKVEAAG